MAGAPLQLLHESPLELLQEAPLKLLQEAPLEFWLGTHLKLEMEMAINSRTHAWKIQWMEEPGSATVHGAAKSQTLLSKFTFTFTFHHRPLVAKMVKNLPGMQETWV